MIQIIIRMFYNTQFFGGGTGGGGGAGRYFNYIKTKPPYDQ